MLAATTTQRVLNAVPTWPLVIGVVGGAVALASLTSWKWQGRQCRKAYVWSRPSGVNT
jgi:hypothetical protein